MEDPVPFGLEMCLRRVRQLRLALRWSVRLAPHRPQAAELYREISFGILYTAYVFESESRTDAKEPTPRNIESKTTAGTVYDK